MPTNTPVDRPTALACLRAGESTAVVAERLHCSTRTIERIREKAGLPSTQQRRPFTAAELAEVDRLLADGASVREALRSIGRGPKSWARRFRGRGWTHAQRAEFVAARKQAKRMGIDLFEERR